MAFKEYPSRDSRGDLDRGAARRLAIESTQNIANVTLGAVDDHPDVPIVARLLRGRSLPVAQVASELSWDSGRVAEALARGGESGTFAFAKTGDTTLVGLAR